MSPAERLRRRSRGLLRRFRSRPELLVVRLKGDLGADTARETGRALRAALREEPKILEVDVSRVTHLSTDGAMPLFLAARGAREQGTRFRVTRAPELVGMVMRRVGLERYLSGEGSAG
ncbi:STAS domain-containing protein [Streptomyces lateritius]|uniref:STAS domain-containing protein n=1 Tax=Streptomyces lateritius TaxID=67313 RepID=UPI001C8B9013|nr:STAS domain-containing protein [Streptomyces lateritius]MBX9427489.1 STAS domain-containing protein [Streptomyces lateritius]